MINLYSDTTENVPWLLIINSATSYNFKVIYSVPITAKKGDIIQASFRGEVTSEQVYNVQIGTFIKLGTSAIDSALTNLILPAAGENVIPAVHHMVINGTCSYTFTADFTGFINVVGYANSTAAGSDNTLTVEQGYGRLDVLQFCADAPVVVPPTLPDGSITLTAAQRQQILAALLVGSQDRTDAAALLQ